MEVKISSNLGPTKSAKNAIAPVATTNKNRGVNDAGDDRRTKGDLLFEIKRKLVDRRDRPRGLSPPPPRLTQNSLKTFWMFGQCHAKRSPLFNVLTDF